MSLVQRPLRVGFQSLERLLSRSFPDAWNPLYHLGALGFLSLWVVSVSGLYIYVFFDTGTTQAYESVEYITHEQWYLAGVMRSLHRYASDGMVVFMALHLLREYALDRHRGARWFSWITGVVVIWLVYASGITGYWLVWDELAQYIAVKSAEWLDWLGIFGEPIARNFLTPESLDGRFFTLLLFLHIAVPLILLLVLWLHLQRVSRPRINPARGLGVGLVLSYLAVSLVKPAVSHAPADLAMVPAVVNIDWFYLTLYPLIDIWSAGALWGVLGAITVILAALPWMPPLRRPAPAVVDLEHCNGCGRCVDDCPYDAVRLVPRSDGKPFEHEALVKPDLCVSCGICVGACPPSTPFRSQADLPTGIDLPDYALTRLRDDTDAAASGLRGSSRVLVFGCRNAVDPARLREEGVGTVSLPCIGMLAPSFIDYVLSRRLADGVLVTGCREHAAFHRLGVRWTEARLERRRDPQLRRRVPLERVERCYAGPGDETALRGCLAAFRERLTGRGSPKPERSAAAGNDHPALAESGSHD